MISPKRSGSATLNSTKRSIKRTIWFTSERVGAIRRLGHFGKKGPIIGKPG